MRDSIRAGRHRNSTGVAYCASLLLLSFSFLISPVFSQSTATITGFVKDSSGGVIQRATVKVTSLATGFTRTVVTSETGNYRVTNLIPGLFEVAVSMSGFKGSVAQVEVTVGQVAHLEFVMEIGDISERITVTNTVAPVDVEQGRVSSLVIF